jgi:hypothetical protein
MGIINIPTIDRADTHDGHAALCPSYTVVLQQRRKVGWAKRSVPIAYLKQVAA